ncbi:hypothetical protein EYF80_005816 [Liparis tanakae]|uniref:Uncharacterized protein n=1 Tax=Liparis tanakae TaxID=230148 RepID=A0A4Z2J0U2_9TELE|nr:hypothetical protein EYF80_005816 [Liparis tanakae]
MELNGHRLSCCGGTLSALTSHCQPLINKQLERDRKTLGAERGSLEGSTAAPDDKPSRASSQQSLSHNIVPLFVNRAEEESRKLRGRWR